MRYSNISIAGIGLAQYIIEQNKIDYIYVSDIHKYGAIADIINSYSKIPIILSLLNEMSFQQISESYTKAWFNNFKNKIDFVLIHKYQKKLYEDRIINKNNLFIDEYLEANNTNNTLKESLVILGGLTKATKINHLIERIDCFASKIDTKLLIWGENKNKIYENLKNDNIEYINFENGLDIFENLKGSMAMTTETVLNNREDIYNKKIHLDSVLLLLSYGLYPIINKNSNTHDALIRYYEPKLKELNESLYVLTSVNLNAENYINNLI